jgi:Ni/Fe-hydrogenase subunit HybB-like protein
VGLVPDLAVVRDLSIGWKRKVFAALALGWRGAGRHWHHYRIAYGLLAGLATPLVLSVHSIVSLDFAEAQVPGWHSTIFPPFFVAGAIFSGFAMVLTLLIPCRYIFRLEQVVTRRHLDSMARMLLVTGWIVTYAYIIEQFIAWYSGDEYEIAAYFHVRPAGDFAGRFWLMIFCNCLVPQLFWFKRLRENTTVLFVASVLINVGMWLERFMIIIGSLYRERMPSSFGHYSPTWVDLSIFGGTLCFFGLLFLVFLRVLPIIPITELKEMRHEMSHGGKS